MCSWTFRRNVSALRAVEETCVGPTSGALSFGILVEGPAEGRDHMPKASLPTAESLSLSLPRLVFLAPGFPVLSERNLRLV